MLLPGYADSVDLQGYLIERCNECHQQSVFAVFEARRRLTISMIRTPVNIQSHLLMECKTCGARFGVPRSWEGTLPERLMSQEQLSAKIREMRGSAAFMPPSQRQVGNGRRTAYQILQVDPLADQDVIEAAFKRLALKAHPDRNEGPEAAERMRELVAARDLLLTPERRQAYDRSIGIARPAEVYQRDAAPARHRPAQTAKEDPRRQPSSSSNRQRPTDRTAATPASPAALRAPEPRPKGIRADEV